MSAAAIRLYGRRVMLRPLVAVRLAAVDRGAPAQRAVAHAVGAAAARATCSTRPATVTRSCRAATPATASGRWAWPTASGCSSTTTSPARSTSTTSSAARCRAAPSATGSTATRPGNATSPKAWWCVCRFAFEQLHLHRLEICIVPRNSNSRRVMEVLALPRGGRRPALPRDQRHVGGPRALRDHRRGVERAPRRARGRLAVRPRPERRSGCRRRRGGWLGLRLAHACCAASTSFIFQWREPARARRSSSPSRHRGGAPAPRLAGFVHFVGLVSGTHLRRNGLQLAVDAVPFVVGMCSQVHLRWRGHVLAAMALAHWYLRVVRNVRLLSVTAR